MREVRLPDPGHADRRRSDPDLEQEGQVMSIFTIAVMIIAVITAFTFGLVTGEDIAKERHDYWASVFAEEDEDDDEHSGDDR